MKRSIILLIAISSILIVASLAFAVNSSSQTPKNSLIVNRTAGSDITKKPNEQQRNETLSSQPSTSSGKIPTGEVTDPNNVTSDPSSGSLGEPNSGEVAQNNATTTGNTPSDGRIYTGGEAPYAYIPTHSQKEPMLPIVPLTPID